MRQKRKLHLFILALGASSACMWGCAQGNKEGTQDLPKDDIQSVEEAPDLSYEVPEQVPGILTDMSGYDAKNRKTVFFHGKKLPDSFELIDANTEETVFTAELTEKEYHEDTGEYNSYGDFSAFQTPGEYYIRCGQLGRSYSFVIEEDLYLKVFEENFRTLTADTPAEEGANEEASAEELCDTLSVMLLSYELYPKAYADGMVSEPNKIPDILDEAAQMIAELSRLQDTRTGKVEGITDCYSGILAKFSYLYQGFDSTYATECLKAADLAWKYTDGNKEECLESQHFFAAAELYRATGQYKYHQAAKEYGTLLLKQGGFTDDYALYGAVTYLSTKRKVDVNLCTKLMQHLMSKAEEIIDASKESFYLATGERGGTQEILSRMLLLCVADYISTNQEYAVIIENQYHYLKGRNPWSEPYLKEDSLRSRGYLLMMLSQMLQADLTYSG